MGEFLARSINKADFSNYRKLLNPYVNYFTLIVRFESITGKGIQQNLMSKKKNLRQLLLSDWVMVAPHSSLLPPHAAALESGNAASYFWSRIKLVNILEKNISLKLSFWNSECVKVKWSLTLWSDEFHKENWYIGDSDTWFTMLLTIISTRVNLGSYIFLVQRAWKIRTLHHS